MKTIEEILSYNIRMRLEALGWNQRDLAKAAGLTEQSVTKLLKGRPSRMSNQKAIAEALGCSREDLMKVPQKSSNLLKAINEMQKIVPQDILSWLISNPIDEGRWAMIRRFIGMPDKGKKKKIV